MLVRSWSTGTLPFILEPVFHPHLVRREHMYQYIIHVGVAVAGDVGLHFNSDPNPSEQELLGSVDGIVIVVLWLQRYRGVLRLRLILSMTGQYNCYYYRYY